MTRPLDEYADDDQARKDPKATIGKLAELLARSGIDVADVAKINRVNLWQGFYKDKAGESHLVDMAGIQLVPGWAAGPQWPQVGPGPKVTVRAPKNWRPAQRDHLVAVELPDIQAGFWRDRHGDLHPTHDERAVDVALRIIATVKPDVIIVGGDGADFPEFGKYRLSPAFYETTQPTVDYLTTLAARLRAAGGPDCRIVWLPGNHEERLPNYILDNARAAFRLRVGNTPKSWPVLTLPNLCRFDDLGIEWIPGYPANEFWVNDRLHVVHGAKVRSNGSTAHAYLDDEKASTIFNHVHRVEYAARTRHSRYGARTIMAASAGCLCRTDGGVPSTKGGIDEDGLPISVAENWQQGVAVISYEPGDGPFGLELVPIHDGVAWFRGHRLTTEEAM